MHRSTRVSTAAVTSPCPPANAQAVVVLWDLEPSELGSDAADLPSLTQPWRALGATLRALKHLARTQQSVDPQLDEVHALPDVYRYAARQFALRSTQSLRFVVCSSVPFVAPYDQLESAGLNWLDLDGFLSQWASLLDPAVQPDMHSPTGSLRSRRNTSRRRGADASGNTQPLHGVIDYEALWRAQDEDSKYAERVQRVVDAVASGFTIQKRDGGDVEETPISHVHLVVLGGTYLARILMDPEEAGNSKFGTGILASFDKLFKLATGVSCIGIGKANDEDGSHMQQLTLALHQNLQHVPLLSALQDPALNQSLAASLRDYAGYRGGHPVEADAIGLFTLQGLSLAAFVPLDFSGVPIRADVLSHVCLDPQAHWFGINSVFPFIAPRDIRLVDQTVGSATTVRIVNEPYSYSATMVHDLGRTTHHPRSSLTRFDQPYLIPLRTLAKTAIHALEQAYDMLDYTVFLGVNAPLDNDPIAMPMSSFNEGRSTPSWLEHLTAEGTTTLAILVSPPDALSRVTLDGRIAIALISPLKTMNPSLDDAACGGYILRVRLVQDLQHSQLPHESQATTATDWNVDCTLTRLLGRALEQMRHHNAIQLSALEERSRFEGASEILTIEPSQESAQRQTQQNELQTHSKTSLESMLESHTKKSHSAHVRAKSATLATSAIAPQLDYEGQLKVQAGGSRITPATPSTAPPPNGVIVASDRQRASISMSSASLLKLSSNSKVAPSKSITQQQMGLTDTAANVLPSIDVSAPPRTKFVTRFFVPVKPANALALAQTDSTSMGLIYKDLQRLVAKDAPVIAVRRRSAATALMPTSAGPTQLIPFPQNSLYFTQYDDPLAAMLLSKQSRDTAKSSRILVPSLATLPRTDPAASFVPTSTTDQKRLQQFNIARASLSVYSSFSPTHKAASVCFAGLFAYGSLLHSRHSERSWFTPKSSSRSSTISPVSSQGPIPGSEDERNMRVGAMALRASGKYELGALFKQKQLGTSGNLAPTPPPVGTPVTAAAPGTAVASPYTMDPANISGSATTLRTTQYGDAETTGPAANTLPGKRAVAVALSAMSGQSTPRGNQGTPTSGSAVLPSRRGSQPSPVMLSGFDEDGYRRPSSRSEVASTQRLTKDDANFKVLRAVVKTVMAKYLSPSEPVFAATYRSVLTILKVIFKAREDLNGVEQTETSLLPWASAEVPQMLQRLVPSSLLIDPGHDACQSDTKLNVSNTKSPELHGGTPVSTKEIKPPLFTALLPPDTSELRRKEQAVRDRRKSALMPATPEHQDSDQEGEHTLSEADDWDSPRIPAVSRRLDDHPRRSTSLNPPDSGSLCETEAVAAPALMRDHDRRESIVIPFPNTVPVTPPAAPSAKKHEDVAGNVGGADSVAESDRRPPTSFSQFGRHRKLQLPVMTPASSRDDDLESDVVSARRAESSKLNPWQATLALKNGPNTPLTPLAASSTSSALRSGANPSMSAAHLNAMATPPAAIAAAGAVSARALRLFASSTSSANRQTQTKTSPRIKPAAMMSLDVGSPLSLASTKNSSSYRIPSPTEWQNNSSRPTASPVAASRASGANGLYSPSLAASSPTLLGTKRPRRSSTPIELRTPVPMASQGGNPTESSATAQKNPPRISKEKRRQPPPASPIDARPPMTPDTFVMREIGIPPPPRVKRISNPLLHGGGSEGDV